jgi:hypothetical protein
MKRTKNPAASVKARLLHLAQKQSEPFEALMLRYAFEKLSSTGTLGMRHL